MSYNRENLLLKIIEIQEIVLKYKKMCVPQKCIFELYIEKQYHISYSCFNEYLCIPAKAQLQALRENKKLPSELRGEIQLDLFEE